MKIDPNAAMFPAPRVRNDVSDSGTITQRLEMVGGLTIRAHFAAMAMQGLLADQTFKMAARECSKTEGGKTDSLVAAAAIQFADALIAELSK